MRTVKSVRRAVSTIGREHQGKPPEARAFSRENQEKKPKDVLTLHKLVLVLISTFFISYGLPRLLQKNQTNLYFFRVAVGLFCRFRNRKLYKIRHFLQKKHLVGLFCTKILFRSAANVSFYSNPWNRVTYKSLQLFKIYRHDATMDQSRYESNFLLILW